MKTDLEVFVEMNELDVENKSTTIGVCYDWRNAHKCKGGAVIEMGIPEDELYKIMNDERVPVLLLIDKKKFFELKNQTT